MVDFTALNSSFQDLPVASGNNVFLAAEYAKATGIKKSRASERLRALADDGKVRRVRTSRGGKTVLAWEYLAKRETRPKVAAK